MTPPPPPPISPAPLASFDSEANVVGIGARLSTLRPSRRVVLSGAVVATVVGALASGMGPAEAAGGGYAIAFQANTNALWWSASGDHSQGMAAGTSPSIVTVPGGYQCAFQANTGNLIVYGDAVKGNTGQGMAAGTSPSITRLSNGDLVAAFQANTGNLYIWHSRFGPRNMQLGMAAGTSPAIAANNSGGYRIAFQANTGSLWHYDSAGGPKNWGLGLMTKSSPSICSIGSGYQIAFQANTTSLWTVGDAGSRGDLRLGCAAPTSPSIAQGVGGYRIAFQANTGSLWHYDSAVGPKNWGLGLMTKTNPATAGLSGGGYQIGFQSNTGSLWSVGDAGSVGDLRLGLNAPSSPAIAGGGPGTIASGGYGGPGGSYNARIIAGAGRYGNGYPYGQQCLVFVEDQIRYAGGPSLAMGYNGATYQSQWAQCATQQSWSTVAPGDICQWYDPNGKYGPLHTAIITGGNSPSNATVVDCNYGIPLNQQNVGRGTWASRNVGFHAGTFALWRVR